MTKKYEILSDDKIDAHGRTLFRIRALTAFSDVGIGEIGGYIEFDANLSQRDNARVDGDASIVWFSKVGSENGTLTVCRALTGLFVSRGCFAGTDIEFLSAVDNKHGADSKIGREYHMLIEVARSRLEV